MSKIPLLSSFACIFALAASFGCASTAARSPVGWLEGARVEAEGVDPVAVRCNGDLYVLDREFRSSDRAALSVRGTLYRVDLDTGETRVVHRFDLPRLVTKLGPEFIRCNDAHYWLSTTGRVAMSEPSEARSEDDPSAV